VRRRRRLSPRKSGGALWAIIYIDLMTQIMVFFVILWSVERKAAEADTPPPVGNGMGMGNQTVRMVNLPGDVLFGSGKTELGAEGKEVFAKLFGDPASGVLSFDQGGLAQRKLVIHGHTDDVGDKNANFLLGYQRAWAVYQEIRKYGGELPDHVVICTHADNTPAEPVPHLDGPPSEEQREALRTLRAHNRRITVEDLLISPPAAEK